MEDENGDFIVTSEYKMIRRESVGMEKMRCKNKDLNMG